MTQIASSNHFKPFAKHKFQVTHEGELVTLEFGNVPITMHYKDALNICALIHHQAKVCKSANGDTSRNYHVLGTLTDAEANDKMNL